MLCAAAIQRPRTRRQGEQTYHSIETSRIIRAFERHVPGVYVRDYRGNGGHLALCRGYRTIYDHWADTDKHSTALPAETLCNLTRGFMPAATLHAGLRTVAPGWRLEMRRAGRLISAEQRRRIEAELHERVFT